MIIRKVDECFTEEALKAQDGKTCPLTLENGGPIIGEVTMSYDPHQKALLAEMRIDDDNVAKFLSGPMPPMFS